MTLSISDNVRITSTGNLAGVAGAANSAGLAAPTSYARIARRYLLAAAGCLVFAFVYAQFSHEVYSLFMTYMFAIPLLGGALPVLVCHLVGTRPAPRLARQTWALALASLTVASCLRGVFEIAGTASPLLWVYVFTAVAFAAIAIVAFVKN